MNKKERSKDITNSSKVIYTIIALVVIFVVGQFTTMIIKEHNIRNTVYDEFYPNNHDLIFKTTDVNKTEYINELEKKTFANPFSEGMRFLMIARLIDNSTEENIEKKQDNYIEACNYFLQFNSNDIKERAINYEAMASLNCLNKREKWFNLAIYEWKKTNYSGRINILNKLINNQSQEFNTTEINKQKLNLSNKTSITINTLEFNTENKTILVQNERTIRDWLTQQINNSFNGELLITFLEKETYNETELREDIGWHEGARLKDINASYIPAVATIVSKYHESEFAEDWYSSDEKGIFRFDISIDKLYYPTVFWLSNDISVLFDTHGISNLVSQAINQKVDYVLGCCDFPGKVKAAEYLSKKGIKTICHTDRFVYQALGSDAEIIGSPVNKNKTYIANPLTINRGEKIVLTTTSIPYPYQYYDTPDRYFSEINKTFPLNIFRVDINNYNQTAEVFKVARKENVKIVGYRIFNSYDYRQAKSWLKESDDNQIVLFHSSPYPYAQILMKEFEDQVHSTDSIIE